MFSFEDIPLEISIVLTLVEIAHTRRSANLRNVKSKCLEGISSIQNAMNDEQDATAVYLQANCHKKGQIHQVQEPRGPNEMSIHFLHVLVSQIPTECYTKCGEFPFRTMYLF